MAHMGGAQDPAEHPMGHFAWPHTPKPKFKGSGTAEFSRGRCKAGRRPANVDFLVGINLFIHQYQEILLPRVVI